MTNREVVAIYHETRATARRMSIVRLRFNARRYDRYADTQDDIVRAPAGCVQRRATGPGAPAAMTTATDPQLVHFLDSVAQTIDGEPTDPFADDDVREAAENLRRLLGTRLDEATNEGGTPMTTTTLTRPTGRQLLEPDLFDRLARRVACDQDLDDDLAARTVDQALVFLRACADNPHLPLAPSALVDHGWHASLLHTREYAEFCDRIANVFIHHHPTDPGEDGSPMVDTIKALDATGLHVDLDLWTETARCQKCKRCHQCHGGCYDSPG